MRIDRHNIGIGWLLAATLVVLVLAAASARAATWTFVNCSNGGVNATCAIPGGLTARGVADTGASGAIAKAGAVLYGGGIGLTAAGEATGSPQHAIDNDGRTEALYLNFGQPVDLDSITIGWRRNDADVSLFRYIGSGNPWDNGDLFGETFGSLTANGWALVGHYANLADDVARAVNAGNAASQYWLLGAYTPAAPGACIGALGAVCDSGDDYFKLKSLATSLPPPCSATGGIACGSTVPEPGSLALLGGALLSALALRRRRAR